MAAAASPMESCPAAAADKARPLSRSWSLDWRESSSEERRWERRSPFLSCLAAMVLRLFNSLKRSSIILEVCYDDQERERWGGERENVRYYGAKDRKRAA